MPPALEHAVGNFDIGKVPSAGDHLGLVAIVGEVHYLSQPQLALEEADRLVVQAILDRAAADLDRRYRKPVRSNAAGLALAVGKEV